MYASLPCFPFAYRGSGIRGAYPLPNESRCAMSTFRRPLCPSLLRRSDSNSSRFKGRRMTLGLGNTSTRVAKIDCLIGSVDRNGRIENDGFGFLSTLSKGIERQL